MGEYVRLGELLPGDLVDGTAERYWRIPEWAFKPDQWTVAFLRGLIKARLDGSVWEVGVGSGLASFFLRVRFPLIELYLSDFDARCTELTADNLRNGLALGRGYHPLYGSWNLVAHDRQKPPYVNAIVGCIPQALLPTGWQLNAGDNEAHYYDPCLYPESQLHHLGLGLNEALLVRARQVLLPGGRVVLNLGGRPRLDCLMQMFWINGYRPTVLHDETIEQHRGTCLQPFADLEDQGERFEFFGDSGAKEPIISAEAERRRLAGDPVFHKIYVIEGTMV